MIYSKPYKSFWISVPIIIILSVIGHENLLDIQLHDTYFVISALYIGLTLSILSGTIGIIYYVARHLKLINWITVLHVSVTLLAFTVMMIDVVLMKNYIGRSGSLTINNVIVSLFLLGLGVQPLFIMNIGLGIFKAKY